MATYFFETITDGQAAAYAAGEDHLVFGAVGETACNTIVRYNPATKGKSATITVISGVSGRERTFPAALAGGQIIFPDGSRLFRDEAETEGPVATADSAPPIPEGVMERIFADRGPESHVVMLDLRQDPDWDRADVLDFRPAIEQSRKLVGDRGNNVIFSLERRTYPFGGERHGPPPRRLGPSGHQTDRHMGRHIG